MPCGSRASSHFYATDSNDSVLIPYPTATMQIRAATIQDAPSLWQAEVTVAAIPGRLVSRPKELLLPAFVAKIGALSERGSYVVAVEGERIVGHAVLEPMSLAAIAHVLRLTVVVHPGHSGRGVGTALVSHLQRIAQAAPDVHKLELLVRQTNARAIRLYERLGFVEEGRFKQRVRRPDGSFIDDVAMAWFPHRGPEKLVFLPGAAGNLRVWEPVARGLSHGGERRFVGWPGLGGTAADDSVRGLDDLVMRVLAAITEPVVLFGQSMGGVIALRAALSRPTLVRGLVLSVTSGGVDVAALGAVDWRPAFVRENPGTPRWFLDARDDMSEALPRVAVPTLLLWGDADEISPVAVGRRLAELLPNAELVVLAGGGHDLVHERAPEVLPHIARHLARVASLSPLSSRGTSA